MHPLYRTIITGRKFLIEMCAAVENTRGHMVFAGLDFDLNWVPDLSSVRSARKKIHHFRFGCIVFRGRNLMSGFPIYNVFLTWILGSRICTELYY
jgi:hypothetical protein